MRDWPLSFCSFRSVATTLEHFCNLLQCMYCNVYNKKKEQLHKKPAEKPSAPVSVHRAVSRGDSSVGSTVDLRGMTAEEAVTALQMYLDRAAMTNLNELTVIHGKGTGVLRRAVADELKHNRLVASYRLGRYGEGETGVTIVELK